MTTSDHPMVEQTMLIRVSPERVFQAFVDPNFTTRFWFTDSDGPLEERHTVTWEWKPYACSCQVHVETIERCKRIVFKWGNEREWSTVEWLFEPRNENDTLVTVRNFGFTGHSDPFSTAIDSMGGFSLVLANAKAFLEHGLSLNLIYDKAPDAIVK